LPKERTYYWEDASESFRARLDCRVGKPVLVSSLSDSEFMVLCTRGLIIGDSRSRISINYNKIVDILGPPLSESTPKAEMENLTLIINSGSEFDLKVPKGADFFAVWNILLMLVNLS
jgi:hypothetical protein